MTINEFNTSTTYVNTNLTSMSSRPERKNLWLKKSRKLKKPQKKNSKTSILGMSSTFEVSLNKNDAALFIDYFGA